MVVALATQFMAQHERQRLHDCADRVFVREPIPRCAAESYPRLALGRNDAALFQRILPWDHAAGVLFIEEAGGCATHWDGYPYQVGSPRQGLIVASSREAWALAWTAFAPALQIIAPLGMAPLGIPGAALMSEPVAA
jgi:fructose-1,6-bisphosphatase/inositol monophosphatase family enzyme